MGRFRRLNFTGLLVPTDAGADIDLALTGAAWKIYYTNGSGVFTALSLGAADTVLASAGAAAAPTFTALKRIVFIKAIADTTVLTTGDGKMLWTVPSDLGGMNLVDADAAVHTVSSSGTPTVQIRNVTQTADMLSTRITIDANEKTSYTAATAPVIDTANDDVATGDEIAIDVDVAGTGAQGLDVILVFQMP